jgi:hypothetical protein
MKRTNENIVSSYFYYMWNRWSKTECETVFGSMAGHFWEKWCGLSNPTPSGAAERLYAELGNEARRKIVKRACELYNGQQLVSENVADESKIFVCECCGSQDIQIRAWVDGNTNEYISEITDDDDDFWCDACEEHHGFLTLKEYKEAMLRWWQTLDMEENKRLSGDADDLDAWWNNLTFDQQRILYKENFWEEGEDDE